MLSYSWLSYAVWLNIFFLGLTGFTSPTFSRDDMFRYNNLTLSLPEGWTKEEIPRGSEKELIGSLKSRDIPGTSILIFCYQGRRYNYSSVRIVGLKTIASVFPKGQEMIEKKTDVRTGGGLAAVVELWRGVADASGTSAYLHVPMGIMETNAGWIMMLGFTPEPTGSQLENAFLKMIRSAGDESAPQTPLDLEY